MRMGLDSLRWLRAAVRWPSCVVFEHRAATASGPTVALGPLLMG